MIDYKDYESFTSKKEEWKRFKTDGIESNYEISSYGVMFEILLPYYHHHQQKLRYDS